MVYFWQTVNLNNKQKYTKQSYVLCATLTSTTDKCENFILTFVHSVTRKSNTGARSGPRNESINGPGWDEKATGQAELAREIPAHVNRSLRGM